MTKENMTMKLTTLVSLKEAAATLHDASFTSADINFDAQANFFSLRCWIPDASRDQRTSPREWKAYRLSFRDVTDCKIVTREEVAFYELATIHYSKADREL